MPSHPHCLLAAAAVSDSPRSRIFIDTPADNAFRMAENASHSSLVSMSRAGTRTGHAAAMTFAT